MADAVEFRILGELEISVDGRRVEVTAPRQRKVLAALLLRCGHVVSADELAEVLWDDRPPATAANQIARSVFALRRAIAVAGLIETRSSGYVLLVREGQVDTQRVDVHAARMRAALDRGDLGQAAIEGRAALALWRGPVLLGVTARCLQAETARWEERRLALTEEFVELQLELGRHHEVIAELSAVVGNHPLRQRPRGQLMIALYRAGRQAEALAVYRDTRHMLADGLGLEPGVQLRQLEHAILTEDPALDPPRAVDRLEPPPCQLPSDIADFTGRTAEVALIRRPRQRSETMAVWAIAGRAGVGKTALAVHAAHRLRADYNDGQLFVDLHGTRTHPAEPATVLATFLRALGFGRTAIPDDIEERAGLYRSVLADRRVLVVLDDAVEESQVLPLLPGCASCGVLVTSRPQLTGLPGARLIRLEPFDTDQAMALLGEIIGRDRLSVEPRSAAELVRLCGRLALAVRIAGSKLAAHPHWPLARLIARLSDEHRLLDELRHGGLDVRARLDQSYRRLDELSQRVFRRLGALDMDAFTAVGAAELLGIAPVDAEIAFERLVDAQLLTLADRQGWPSRYHIDELTRGYAVELALDDPPHVVATGPDWLAGLR